MSGPFRAIQIIHVSINLILMLMRGIRLPCVSEPEARV